MEKEIYKLLKEKEKLCANDIVEILKFRRSHVSNKLVKMEKMYKEITSNYEQVNIGNKIFSIKYYKFNYNI